MSEPDAASDDTVVPDPGIAAEDRGAGIDDDAVPDIRVPFDPLDQRPVLCDIEAFGAQRDMLIELDVFADRRRLPDDDARPVIDEKGIPDHRAGMDVDAGQAVGMRDS